MTGLFDTDADQRQPERPWRGIEPEKSRQKVLFSGMDCLPDQLDLFEVDGPPEPPTSTDSAGLDLSK